MISVLTPGVLTLDTSVDLGLRLVRRPCLPEDPKCLVMTTLGALDLCLGQGGSARLQDQHLLVRLLIGDIAFLLITTHKLAALAALHGILALSLLWKHQ